MKTNNKISIGMYFIIAALFFVAVYANRMAEWELEDSRALFLNTIERGTYVKPSLRTIQSWSETGSGEVRVTVRGRARTIEHDPYTARRDIYASGSSVQSSLRQTEYGEDRTITRETWEDRILRRARERSTGTGSIATGYEVRETHLGAPDEVDRSTWSPRRLARFRARVNLSGTTTVDYETREQVLGRDREITRETWVNRRQQRLRERIEAQGNPLLTESE
jgi:hypothetical protein